MSRTRPPELSEASETPRWIGRSRELTEEFSPHGLLAIGLIDPKLSGGRVVVPPVGDAALNDPAFDDLRVDVDSLGKRGRGDAPFRQ
jgi:hypothetical protein